MIATLELLLPQFMALAALSATLPRLWAQRREVGAPSLGALAMVILVWGASDALLLVDPTISVAIRTSLLMWVLAPAAWLAFSLEYTGRRELLRHPLASLVWLLLLGSAVLILRSPTEVGLVWSVGPEGRPVWGPLVRGQEWVEVAGLGVGLLLLAVHIGAAPRGRGRLAAIAAIAAVVAGLELAGVSGTGPEFPVVVWATTLALTSLGLIRPGAQDLSPVARTLVVEELRDVVVVLDRRGRIADLNRAARDRLGLTRYGPLPPGLGAYWFSHTSEAAERDDNPPRELVPLPDRKGDVREYEVTLARLKQGTDAGRTVITLRDVTEAERLARDLASRTEELSAANAELAKVNERLERLANTDSLTELANRRRFMDRLAEEVERSTRYGRPLSLLCLDLDEFKKVNDTWGHPVGDEVLRRTGSILRELGRESDVPARMGGEEFAVLLPETDVEGAVSLAERIRRRVAAEVVDVDGGAELKVTVSVGVSSLGASIPDGEALLQAGDRALYRAKELGRNRVALAERGGRP